MSISLAVKMFCRLSAETSTGYSRIFGTKSGQFASAFSMAAAAAGRSMDMELGKLIGFGSNVGMSNPNWPWGLEDCLTLLSELPTSACAEKKELSAYMSMVPGFSLFESRGEFPPESRDAHGYILIHLRQPALAAMDWLVHRHDYEAACGVSDPPLSTEHWASLREALSLHAAAHPACLSSGRQISRL